MQQQQQTKLGNTIERRRIPKLMVGVLGGQPLPTRRARMRRNGELCCSLRAKKIGEDPGWDLFFPWSSIAHAS